MSSSLKMQTLETSLIEKIKAELKKRTEAKAKRMLLRRPKRLAKRSGLSRQLVGSHCENARGEGTEFVA